MTLTYPTLQFSLSEQGQLSGSHESHPIFSGRGSRKFTISAPNSGLIVVLSVAKVDVAYRIVDRFEYATPRRPAYTVRSYCSRVAARTSLFYSFSAGHLCFNARHGYNLPYLSELPILLDISPDVGVHDRTGTHSSAPNPAPVTGLLG